MSNTVTENPAFSLEVQDRIAILRFKKAFLNVARDLYTRGEFLRTLDALESDPQVLGLLEINDEEFSGEDEIGKLMKELAQPGGRRLAVLHRFKLSAIKIMSRNLEFGKPVVSGLSGDMTLDEFGVALTSDRLLMSDECLVKKVSLGVGLPPGPILTYFLPRVLGHKRAVTLMTRTDPLGASEALALGLADKVVPRADLENECRAELLQLAKLPDPVVSATRKLVFSQFDRFEEHADRSINMTVQILQSRDW